MAKKTAVVRLYRPEITLEQVLNYKKGHPETYTPSKLVNTLCAVYSENRHLIEQKIAVKVGQPYRELSHALLVLTGMDLHHFRNEILAERIKKTLAKYPELSKNEIAMKLGYKSYSTISQFMDNNKELFPEHFLDGSGRELRIKNLVERFLRNESQVVRNLYSNLPFRGGHVEEEACLRLLYKHARNVANLALECARHHPELAINEWKLERAALLHNVGMVMTDMPGLHCHGREPYIKHGLLGARWLEEEGYVDIARQIECHIGTSLAVVCSDKGEVERIEYLEAPEGIGLLVAYASCFYSVFDADHRRSLDEVRRYRAKYGKLCLAHFEEQHKKFGLPSV